MSTPSPLKHDMLMYYPKTDLSLWTTIWAMVGLYQSRLPSAELELYQTCTTNRPWKVRAYNDQEARSIGPHHRFEDTMSGDSRHQLLRTIPITRATFTLLTAHYNLISPAPLPLPLPHEIVSAAARPCRNLPCRDLYQSGKEYTTQDKVPELCHQQHRPLNDGVLISSKLEI
jgi:hypothetical protein